MIHIYSKCKIILILITTIFLYQNSFSSVNILSWWNYLDKDILSKLQRECKTTVSVDEYYSSDEFIRRINKQNNYSVVIFSSGVYNLVSDRIENTGINFAKIKSRYHPNVQATFSKQNFLNNVAIFALSTTGFLYDPKEIKINKNDDIKSIFSKARNKKISLLIDDPSESFKLITNEKNILNIGDGVKEFRRFIDGTYFIAANDILKIVEDKEFILSYSWVGEAYQRIKDNPNLKFMVHPKLSYISADLIAILDKNMQTVCVTKILTSKEILDPILSKTFYFSPFGSLGDNSIAAFTFENKNFIMNIENLRWHDTPKKEEHQKMINLWYRIKIALENKFY
jgi:hypothetical protein